MSSYLRLSKSFSDNSTNVGYFDIFVWWRSTNRDRYFFWTRSLSSFWSRCCKKIVIKYKNVKYYTASIQNRKDSSNISLPDLGVTFLTLCAWMYARTSPFNKRFVRPVPLIEPEFKPYSSNNLFTAKPYTL